MRALSIYCLCVALFVVTVAAQYEGLTFPQQIRIFINGSYDVMLVTWATNVSTDESIVQYGLSPSELTQVAIGHQLLFTDGGELHRNLTIHNAVMTDLALGTRYYYRVGDTTLGLSEIYSFLTLTYDQEYDLIVYGDFGIINDQSLNYLIKEAQAGTMDMILHVGDMAYDMDTNNGYRGDTFLNAIQPVAANYPYQVCLGNHESSYNFSHYNYRFSVISENTQSGNNWFWSFNVGPAHFIGVSTEVYYHGDLANILAEQYAWLEQDLTIANANRDKQPWIILYGHRPMYCSNVDDMPDCSSDAENLRRANGTWSLEDIMMKYGVNFYLTGHEHSYERTWPVYRGQVDTSQQNHTYQNPKYPFHILAGSAGCDEDLDYYDDVFYGPWSAVRSASYGYGHLHIFNSTHIRWSQYLNEDLSGVDELWVIQDTPRTMASDEELLQYSHLSDCNEYCYVTCTSSNSKCDSRGDCNNIRDCVDECHCHTEAAAGLLHKVGQGVTASYGKVHRRHAAK